MTWILKPPPRALRGNPSIGNNVRNLVFYVFHYNLVIVGPGTRNWKLRCHHPVWSTPASYNYNSTSTKVNTRGIVQYALHQTETSWNVII